MVQFENPPPKGGDLDVDGIDRDEDSSSSGQNTPNGTLKRKSEGEGHANKKRKKKSKLEKSLKMNGIHSHSKRRYSVSKPARDPRDEAASPPRSAKDDAGTRSPSPVIDFDGLSRPSTSRDPFYGINANLLRSRDSRTP